VIRALRLAFAQHGTVWREWRRSLDQLSRPTAAADIARTILPLHAASTAEALPPATLAALFTRHG